MSDCPTLSSLLLRFIEANPDQLERNETAQQWKDSMWGRRNPAAKLKESLENFLAVFESFDGPAVIELRNAIEPLTR